MINNPSLSYFNQVTLNNCDADQSNVTYFFLQFDEQREQVAVEQILRVIFLDPDRPSPVRIYIFNIFITFKLHLES